MALLSDLSQYKKILLAPNTPSYSLTPSPWVVPRDWTKNNIVEIWGPGGDGFNFFTPYKGGCGGGYARIYNLDLLINTNISYQLGSVNGVVTVFGNFIQATYGTPNNIGIGSVLPDGRVYRTFVANGGQSYYGSGGGAGGPNGNGLDAYSTGLGDNQSGRVAAGGNSQTGTVGVNGGSGTGGFDGTYGAGGGGQYGYSYGGNGSGYGGGGGSGQLSVGTGGHGAIIIYYIPAIFHTPSSWIS
jgi:hypothetical protein